MTDNRPTPTPLDTPEEARQLDRYYLIGLVCMLLLIGAFPVYKLGEPARRAGATETMREENVAIGEAMFAQHCESCHGVDARGGRGFPTLGAKEFLTSVSDRQLQWLISGGVPGSAMTAYDLDLGGPFTAQEVARLVAYLRSMEDGAPSVAGWYRGEVAPARERRAPPASPGKAVGQVNPPAATGQVAVAGTDTTSGSRNPASGRGQQEFEEMFASRCAACHGAAGEGTPIGQRIRPLSGVLAANPDSAFGIIARGVSGTAMMPFGTTHGGPLDDTTIRALVEWLRQTP